MELPSWGRVKGYQSIDEVNSQGSVLEERVFRIDENNVLGQQEATAVTVKAQSQSGPAPVLFMTRKSVAYVGIVSALCLLLLVLASLAYEAQTSSLRAVLQRGPGPFKAATHPEAPSSLWGAVVKPYPTGAFWTNLVVKNGDGPVALHPYGVKCLDSGVHVSYGPTRRSVTQMYITDIFATDLQINSQESYTSRALERYDNGSVTMAYTTAGGGRYRAYLVKGAPFVTVSYENLTPVIQSPLMKITSVDARVRNNAPGVQYIVTLGNFQRWLVFCSEPVVFVWKDNALTASSVVRAGVVRVAILPSQQAEAAFSTLMTYVARYPIGVQTSLVYSVGNNGPQDKTSTLCMNFVTGGTGPLLMYALPHHRFAAAGTGPADASPQISEESRAAQTTLTPIYSMKGKLRAIVADSWKLQISLSPQPTWNYALSEKLPTPQLDQIALQLMLDVKTNLPTATDPYSFGKQIARMARLALISDYLGIPDARLQAITTLENSFSPWVTGGNADALLYDRVYGGVVPTAGLADQQADFGSGWYSDHHFHYGYLIYGAAVLAKLDTPFFDANKGAFDALVRDVCNPDPTDADFPVARHKDWFDGHSWASGLFQQANGKGQESSSEAVNAYYACYLYALATANKDLQWFSHTLLATEVQAAQLYWHMPNDDIYDAIFSASRMVGNIGAFDATVSTWFGSELEYVHGINMMPVTPVTTMLFDQNFAAQQYPLLASRLPPPVSAEKQACANNANCLALGMTQQGSLCCPSPEGLTLACCDADANGVKPMQDEWKGLIYMNHAITDREAARQQILSADGFGIGNSKCNALFFAASRPVPTTTYDLAPRQPDFSHSIKSSCASNSACDSAGKSISCICTARKPLLRHSLTHTHTLTQSVTSKQPPPTHRPRRRMLPYRRNERRPVAISWLLSPRRTLKVITSIFALNHHRLTSRRQRPLLQVTCSGPHMAGPCRRGPESTLPYPLKPRQENGRCCHEDRLRAPLSCTPTKLPRTPLSRALSLAESARSRCLPRCACYA